LTRLALFLVAWLTLAMAPALASPLRERDLVEFVANQVAQRYQVGRDQVEIHWKGRSLESLIYGSVPEGRIGYVIEGTPRMFGLVAVPIRIEVDGKRFRTVFPQLEIKVWQEVWVLNRPMHRDDLFDPSLAHQDRRTMDQVLGAAITGLQDLVGTKARREIRQGSVLVDDMFERPQLVRSGQMVTVKLVSGDLTIVTQGLAVSNGSSGQLITVINPDTHKNYLAKVVAADTVEVKLEEGP
jgi:flagella basal body P-ring formation protein FlgA